MQLLELEAVANDLKYLVPKGAQFGAFSRDLNAYINLVALLKTYWLSFSLLGGPITNVVLF